jgi:hypothetical protein
MDCTNRVTASGADCTLPCTTETEMFGASKDAFLIYLMLLFVCVRYVMRFVEDELRMMWKEGDAVRFEAVSRHLLGPSPHPLAQ